jgi:hypothetical protein
MDRRIRKSVAITIDRDYIVASIRALQFNSAASHQRSHDPNITGLATRL